MTMALLPLKINSRLGKRNSVVTSVIPGIAGTINRPHSGVNFALFRIGYRFD